MLTLRLVRTREQIAGIFGELADSNGAHICYTLEHSYLQPNGSYLPKVPPGTYTCVRGQHQLAHMSAPFVTFEITGVPGHPNILFHSGNVNADSEGCVLVGEAVDSKYTCLLRSRAAFESLMQLLDGVNKFTLEVL